MSILGNSFGYGTVLCMSRAFDYGYGVREFAFATEWSYEVQKNLLILDRYAKGCICIGQNCGMSAAKGVGF